MRAFPLVVAAVAIAFGIALLVAPVSSKGISSSGKTSASKTDDVGPIPTILASKITYYEVEETFQATVTKFNSVSWQTDSSPCISADGSDICALERHGQQTCAANGFPFGTKLYIRGLGLCTVRDRLNSRFGRDRIDWYAGGSETVQAAREFGKQRLEVKVLKPL